MEKMKRFIFNRRGVSPVIATIIIVAVAIVMSIAVAYWVLGLGASLTRYEKLQFTSAYAPNINEVDIALKNTGSAAATVDSSTVFLNGKPAAASDVTFSAVTTTGSLDNGDGTITMPAGGEVTGIISLTGLTSGTTVEITVQTAAGNQYPKVVVLP
jgi:flagellin-like protein